MSGTLYTARERGMARKKSKRVTWSPLSERDIDEILDYFGKKGSLEVGETLVAGIYQEGERLKSRAFQWQTRDDVFPDTRLVIVHPYVIVYRITDSNAEIMRVLHEHRDFGAVFDVDEIL